MLVRSILAVQSLLVISNFSCAGGSNAKLAPESLKESISSALEMPGILNSLPAVYLWILQELKKDYSSCQKFLGYICKNYSDNQAIGGDSGAAGFWSGLIDYHFLGFARIDRRDADMVLYLACTTDHPLTDEIKEYIGIETFLDEPIQTLGQYLNATVRRALKTRLSEPAAGTASRKPQQQLRRFIYGYKTTVVSPSAKCNCAYAFLMNAELQVFAPLISALDSIDEGDACSDIQRLALVAYEEMEKESPEKSIYALRKLFPTMYDGMKDKNYANVMEAYAESGLEPANAEEFRQFALEALKNNQLTRYLSPVCFSIIKAIAEYLDECQSFFIFISEEHNVKEVAFEKSQALHWERFVNESFGRFSQAYPETAQIIVDTIVIPSHAILSQTPYQFDIGEFNSRHLSIEHFLRNAAKGLFVSRVSEIIANADTYERQFEFGFLMQRASLCMTWQDPKYQCACAFLMRIEVEDLELAGTKIFCNIASLFDEPNEFASRVYTRMANISTKQATKAERALRGALPEALSDELDATKAYMDVVDAYTRSGRVLIDVEYFRRFIRGALEESYLTQELSAEQLCIMQSLRDDQDSKSNKMFFWYTFERHVRQDLRSEQTNPFFWHSLIFCCLFEFSQEYPKPGYELIGRVFIQEGAPATPQQVANMSMNLIIELGEALKSIIAERKGAEYPAKYGHTATVMQLLQQDRCSVSRSKVAIDAACNGHISTLAYIIGLKGNFCGGCEEALVRAASKGRLDVVEYLVNFGMNPNFNDGEALVVAATNGRVRVVKYLVEGKAKFSNTAKYRAFLGAVGSESENTLKYILNCGFSFSASAKEDALIALAERGRIHSVKYLIREEKVDPKARDRQSLVSAAKSGSIPLFEYLSDEMALGTNNTNERAMLSAAEYGRKEMVKHLIEERRVDASIQNGQAVVNAAGSGNVALMKYLVEGERVDANSQNGKALVNAAEKGRIDTLKYLIEKGLDFNMDNGIVLTTAIRGQWKEMVKYLFEEKQARPNQADEQAFFEAARTGDKFLVRFQVDLGLYSKAVKQQAIETIENWTPSRIEIIEILNSSL